MWLLKRVLVLNGLFVGVICVCLALLPASDGCVQFSDTYQLKSNYFDVRTGRFFSKQPVISPWFEGSMITAPDYQHVLSIRPQPSDQIDPHFNILVKPVISQRAVGSGNVLRRDVVSPNVNPVGAADLQFVQAQWLPDSYRILARWEDAEIHARSTGQAKINQYITLFDVDGQQLATFQTDVELTHNDAYFIDSISPDGRFFAIQIRRDQECWIQFFATATLTPITEEIQVDDQTCDGQGYQHCLEWSPKGTWSIYRIAHSDQSFTVLFNPDHRERQQLLLPIDYAWKRWSPDERYLTFAILKDDPKSYFVLVDTVEKTDIVISDTTSLLTDFLHIRWTDDGRSILFGTQNFDNAGDYGGLAVLHIQGRQIETLIRGGYVQFTWGTFGEPVLSINDELLVKWSGLEAADRYTFYYGVINVRTGTRRIVLTTTPTDIEQSEVQVVTSPQGEFVFTFDNRVMIITDGGEKRLDITAAEAMTPYIFSASGRWAIFSAKSPKSRTTRYYSFDMQRGTYKLVFHVEAVPMQGQPKIDEDNFYIFDNGFGATIAYDSINHWSLYGLDLIQGKTQQLLSGKGGIDLEAVDLDETGMSVVILLHRSNISTAELVILNRENNSLQSFVDMPLGAEIQWTDCRP